MRAKEFINSLIQSAQQSGTGLTVNIGEINISDDAGPDEEVETALDTNKFVPPLQQKIELLKKQTGTGDKNAESIHNDDDLISD
jgi:hypothetical protein